MILQSILELWAMYGPGRIGVNLVMFYQNLWAIPKHWTIFVCAMHMHAVDIGNHF